MKKHLKWVFALMTSLAMVSAYASESDDVDSDDVDVAKELGIVIGEDEEESNDNSDQIAIVEDSDLDTEE